MTETELEGPDEAGGLSRRIQLRLIMRSRGVTLRLDRNDNVPSNVPVIVGQHGRLLQSETNDVSGRVRLFPALCLIHNSTVRYVQ